MPNRSFNIFFWASLAALAVVYAIGMQLSLMDIDATQYASISKEMFRNGSYLQVFDRGHDYLDKPPLLFWTACLSFKIFGVHDWSYRLPSVLCLILGIYSLYRYAKIFYSEQTARLAALMMASCCAAFLMTQDVRTDTMLTGWTMFAIWQLAEFNNSLKLKNILLGAVGVGLAMLSKGPIGLMVPAIAFSVHFIYKREWKSFFRWQYLIALLVIAIILLPMSYGLYEQYDLPHNKTQYEIHNISGLRFYYWTQSFGRITGESTWSNNPDPFFLMHSFLWTFLPWTVLFLFGLYTEIRSKIKEFKKPGNNEAITVGGFLLILLFLMRSKYQLPHYTYVIHPLAALIAAKYLSSVLSSTEKSKLFSVAYGLQVFVMVVIYTLLFVLLNYVFPVSIIYSILAGISFLFFIYLLFKNDIEKKNRLVPYTLLSFITLSLALNLHFYPHLLRYQAGSEVAKYLDEKAPENSTLLIYKFYADNAMVFYSKLPIKEYIDEKNLNENLVKGHTYIMADSADVKSILTVNPQIAPIKNFNNYEVAVLDGSFINPNTREAQVSKKVLLAY